MDFVNSDEVIVEIVFDLEEGVDMVMVKLGMFYLDIVCCCKFELVVFIFVYQVSGEYVMYMVVFENGWFNCEQVILELLLVFKCVGVDGILMYFVLEVVKFLKQGQNLLVKVWIINKKVKNLVFCFFCVIGDQ